MSNQYAYNAITGKLDLVSVALAAGSGLLLESGNALLLESGDALLTEE